MLYEDNYNPIGTVNVKIHKKIYFHENHQVIFILKDIEY